MDITYEVDNKKFNYRVCAIMINNGKILAMKDEHSTSFYLPGGRVKMGEIADNALSREIKEELGVFPRIVRPLWLKQAFFNEDVDKLDYHELCIYFLLDVLYTELMGKGEKFFMKEGCHTNYFEWLDFDRIKMNIFILFFLKRNIQFT